MIVGKNNILLEPAAGLMRKMSLDPVVGAIGRREGVNMVAGKINVQKPWMRT